MCLTAIAITSVIIIGVFFIGVAKGVDARVTWSVGERNGKTVAEFVFDDLWGFRQIATEDPNVLDYLQTLGTNRSEVTVALVYDCGKVRALDMSHAWIGGIRFRSRVDHGE